MPTDDGFSGHSLEDKNGHGQHEAFDGLTFSEPDEERIFFVRFFNLSSGLCRIIRQCRVNSYWGLVFLM